MGLSFTVKWLTEMEDELDGVEMHDDIKINLIDIKKQISRMLKWIKNLSFVHSRTENPLN